MKYKVIVNPIAGKGFGGRAVPQIRSLLENHGLDYDLVCSQWAGEAVELARRAKLDGYDVVVAAGGDGTCQEVINGMLAAAEPDTPIVGTMGILPVGSGCDFSWSAGVPANLESAAALLARAQTRVVDVGWLTVDGESRYFDNNVGIGFEGVVTLEARKIKRLRGLALYLPAVLRSVFSSLHPAYSIVEYQNDAEWHTVENRLLMLDVCNGARAGGSFFVAPDADLEDELFDICMVADISRMRMLALIPHFLRGTHPKQRDVTMLRTQRISVRSQDPLSAHADGEMVCEAAHHIECEIAPYKVQIIC